MGYAQVLVKKVVVWLWLVAFTAGMSGAHTAPEQQSKRDTPADFTGKVVVISNARRSSSVPMQNVQMKTLGKRRFFVGQIVDMPVTHMYAGATIWIATDQADQVVEFESLERYQQTCAPPPPILAPSPFEPPPGAASGVSQAPSYLPSLPAPAPAAPPPALATPLGPGNQAPEGQSGGR